MFSPEPTNDLSDLLESFVAGTLADAGVWSSPRVSDGLVAYRIVERGPTRVRVCGRIWEIDQTQRSFWLDGMCGPATPMSWQRFIARLVAHGPVHPCVPGSILQQTRCDYTLLGGVADDVRIDMA